MTLRSAVIRLASDQPELREHLLPLLERQATKKKVKPEPLSKEQSSLLKALVDAHVDLLDTDDAGGDIKKAEKREDAALQKAVDGGLEEALTAHGLVGRLGNDWDVLMSLAKKV